MLPADAAPLELVSLLVLARVVALSLSAAPESPLDVSLAPETEYDEAPEERRKEQRNQSAMRKHQLKLQIVIMKNVQKILMWYLFFLYIYSNIRKTI